MKTTNGFRASTSDKRLAAVVVIITITLAFDSLQAQQNTRHDVSTISKRNTSAMRESVYLEFAAAQSCAEAADYACALARLNEIRSIDLNNYEIAQYWNFLAFIKYSQDDLAGAASSYEELLKVPGILAEALKRSTLRILVGIYRHNEQFEQAFNALDRLHVLEGQTPLVLDSLWTVEDGELLLIVSVSPTYPPDAAAQGLEGYVIVEYAVTATGSVSDVRVVESSAEEFETAAVQAVERFKFRPRVEDGHPVRVNSVQSRISFDLEE